MKFTKKKLIIGIGLLIIVGIVGFKFSNRTQKPTGVPVTTFPVGKGDIENNIELTAPLEGTESVDVVSKLHYKVTEINVKEGDRVTKDQIIARLDTESIEKDIRELQDNIELLKIQKSEAENSTDNSYELAKAQLDDNIVNKQKDYEKAVDNMNEAKRKLDNIQTLYNSGIETGENLKQAQLEYDNAKRDVDAYGAVNGQIVPTEAELQNLENIQNGTSTASMNKNIEIAERNLERKKEELLECNIKSGIDGTVTRVNSKVGRFADDTEAEKSMFVIENIDKLQMKVNVSEYDIDQIKEGQSVTISADILGDETVEGVVSRISPTGEQKTGSTERVIPILIDVIGKNDKLIAGINAKAKIHINLSKDTLYVPIECVYDNGDKTYSIYRVNSENKIEIIPVELGIENDVNIEIKGEGINVGDEIIMSPDPSTMTEGTVVMSAQ